MYFLNTDMHMVTITITMFEVVMLVFQIIYFLQRPSDKSRLQYLILLLCLIAHNICSGLFPDPQFAIPIIVQNIIAYLVGFIMSMYVIYYFYKVFELSDLKFFATYGLLFFLFLPFVFLFVVPYLLTGNVRLSAQLTVVVPFLYALGFIYYTARALILKFRTSKKEGKAIDDPLYEHAIAAYISLVCWALLPVIVFFGDFQVLEHSVTNAGFLMMTIIYVRSSIKQSRKEYYKLLQSEKNLQQLNKDLKRKVRKRTKKLEQVIKERKTTFVNLAHETKTPLTLINNYLSDYIEKHGETEEIQIIKKNIDRLTTDIVNFFDVESYEKGFGIYNHDEVSNVTELISFKLALFESVARKKDLDFQCDLQPNLYVKGHPGALDRITNNLVENAIKYSEDNGHVCVRLTANDRHLNFSVTNSGPGIPEDLQRKVFEPYFKLSLSQKTTEGMGLGLSIVRRIVEDLNGHITLSSHPITGTEVDVKLPLASLEPSIHLEEHDVLDFQIPLAAEQATVLLVEDNREMTQYLAMKLAPHYNLVVASNAQQALEKLDTITSLDLIISDVMMKEMDGFQFREQVNLRKNFAHIPFIFLTAKASSEDRIKGLSLGAIDYIEKPFKIQELVFKIDALFANQKSQREALINHAYRSILSKTDGDVAEQSKISIESENRYKLTSREIDIIKLLVTGKPYKLIGDNLHISDKTVAKHISNIFLKVGVSNKLELINKLDFSPI